MSKFIKVTVTGADGKMGREIIELVLKGNMQLVGAVEANQDVIGEIVPGTGTSDNSVVYFTSHDDTSAVKDIFRKSDVVIDFTSYQCTLALATLAAECNLPMVIGTTGLDEENINQLQEILKKVSCVQEFNMSPGMNVLFGIAGQIARSLSDYDLELSEAHHREKKDAPSGSAVKILKILAAARGWVLKKVCKYGRQGMIGKRPKEQIGVSVIRGGGVVGEHTIQYLGKSDQLEITHKAISRATFAEGALLAARWGINRTPGFYGMADVLGLK